MSDRISQYRQVRLVMQIPKSPSYRTYWSLHAVGVRNGVPSSVVLVDGFVAGLAHNCTTEEILEAMNTAVAQSML